MWPYGDRQAMGADRIDTGRRTGLFKPDNFHTEAATGATGGFLTRRVDRCKHPGIRPWTRGDGGGMIASSDRFCVIP
jgi:hypothetical protein